MLTLTFIDLFSQSAALHPDLIAVKDDHTQLTYSALSQQIDTLAAIVHATQGSEHVAIMLPRSVKFVIAMYAIIKAGKCYIPINAGYPTQRLAQILDATKPCAIITTHDTWEHSAYKADPSCRLIFMDDMNISPDYPCSIDAARASNKAALFFTSGTTGLPKGVMQTMEGLTHLVNFTASIQPTGPGSIHAAIADFTFIASAVDILLPLSFGATVLILDETYRKDESRLYDKIVTEGVTHMLMPTGLGINMLNDFDLPLQVLMLAGSKAKRIAADRIKSINVHNLYGCTEFAPITTSAIRGDEPTITLGKPFHDTHCYVVDDLLRPVKKGEKGELCVCSEALSLGYHNMPEATSEKYTACPFEPGKTMLRTGDIVYENADGEYIYCDRKDGMVKVNGHRVEMGEVENATEQIEGVKACVCVAVTQGDTNALALFVESDDTVSEDTVRATLAERLPHYMIPAAITRVDTLPRNDRHKVDRAALASLSLGAVGLDSLALMHIKASLHNGQRTSYPVREFYPISSSQLSVFLDWQNHKNTTQYNNPILRTWSKDEADPKRLAEAIKSVVKAHPMLHAHVVMSDKGMPMLRRSDATDVDCPIHVYSTPITKASLEQYVRPFDLFTDILFRISIHIDEQNVWLFADIHHLVVDGLSVAVLADEVIKAYHGADISTETYTSFDHSLFEAEWMSDAHNSEHIQTYYDTLLSDSEPAIIPVSAVLDKSNGIGHAECDIESKPIDALCRSLNVTPNSYFMTATAECLHRTLRNKKTQFATVCNTRSVNPATERCVGMFANTIPVVYQALHDNSHHAVADAIHSMQHQLQETYDLSFVPFANIAERNGAMASVLFAYQGGVNDRLNQLGIVQLDKDCPIADVIISAFPSDDAYRYTIDVEYDRSKYSHSDMLQLAQMIGTIASSLCVNTYLEEVQNVSAEDAETILNISFGGAMQYDASETFIDQFCRSVKACHDKEAVADIDGRMTYAELDDLTTTIAKRLIAQGTHTGDFVGIMLPRSRYYIAAIIGIQRAGAAYVPIDISYPQERIDYMKADTNAKVIITREWMEDTIAFNDGMTRQESASTPHHLPLTIPTDSPAYVIYTSGSTGQPKGAVIPHRALRSYIEWYNKELDSEGDRRHAHHVSFSFDGSIIDIFCPLASGGSVYVFSDDVRMDMDALVDTLHREEITDMVMTTPLGMSLLTLYPDIHLKRLIVGGEKLTQTPMHGVELVNIYGPTEFTVGSSMCIVTEAMGNDIPIGRPVPNSYTLICDPYGHLMPHGMSGEMCLLGTQIANGYLNRPELTEQRFVDGRSVTAFADHNLRLHAQINSMYMTGDIASYRPDGMIHYIGREDGMVKLRGFRIEIGEIESAIKTYPGITSAVVCVKDVGSNVLCAYYIADTAIDEADISVHLSSRLPKYMVPTVFMQLERMPYTPNGKIDRKALPSPSTDIEETVEPATVLERQILQIVKEQMHVDNVGVTTDLFTLGLSSLMAMRIGVSCQKEIGIKMLMNDIMSHPTVRELAELCTESNAQEAIEAYPPRQYYPLSSNQLGVYVDWSQNKLTNQYNIPMLVTWPRTFIDIERLRESVQYGFNIHAMTKMRLSIHNGEIVQERRDHIAFDLPIINIDEDVERQYFYNKIRPFDLFKDNLVRLAIYVGPTQVYLFADIHHIVFDGLSCNILIEDIVKKYYGTEDVAPEAFTAYDYALYEQSQMNNPEFVKNAESYFDTLLEDVVGIDYPRSNNINADSNGKKVDTYEWDFPAEGIIAYCKKRGVTCNNFMLTALAECLHCIVHEDRIQFITASNGRENLLSISRSIGMFVKTYPIVSALPPEGTKRPVLDAVKAMQQQTQNTYRYNCYPYASLVSRHNLSTNLLFIYQGGIENDRDRDFQYLTKNKAIVPIAIVASPSADGRSFRLSFEYDAQLYSQHDMAVLAEMIGTVAVNMAEEEDFCHVRKVSKEAEEDLIRLSHGETLEYDMSETFFDVFADIIAKYPDNIALKDDDGHWTYAELDTMSRHIAARLILAGINTGDRVGIMLPRSKNYILTIVSILRSGATYVPIDIEYPQERIDYMLEDCGAKLIINEEWLNEAITTAASEDTMAALPHVSPNDSAYIIYTSGSTGRPKGVEIQHRSIRSYIEWHTPLSLIDNTSTVAHHATFSFDASIDGLFCPLAVGACIYVIGDAIRKDIPALAEFLGREKITGLTMPTCIGMILLSLYPDVPIKYILLGGEKLYMTPLTHIRIFNGYGPTEFTVCSCYHEVDQSLDTDIPIGRPVPNSASYVCDRYGNLLPQGINGELFLYGMQIAKGYFNKPEITDAHFVDCPYADATTPNGDKAKMYRTGDIVHYGQDNLLYYNCRRDNQVKISGFRIEIADIEKALGNVDGVSNAVVRVQDTYAGKELAAYIQSKSIRDPRFVQTQLRNTLPEYMIPTLWTIVEQMPMTINGKIDIHKLPIPTRLACDADIVEPNTPEEKKMLECVKQTTGIEQIGVETDIKSLGLSSIKIMKLAFSLRISGFESITFADFYEYRTIRAILNNMQHDGDSRWVGYADDKPVAVYVCGYGSSVTPPSNQVIDMLSQRYSVFVIDTVLQTFDDVADVSFEVLMRIYIDKVVRGTDGRSIDLLTGFCFGSELALHLAQRLADKYGMSPRVAVFDSFYHRSTMHFDVPPQYQNDDVVVRNYSILNALSAQMPDPQYHAGEVIFFRPTELSDSVYMDLDDAKMTDREREAYALFVGQNLADWQKEYPESSFYELPGHHTSFATSDSNQEIIMKILEL